MRCGNVEDFRRNYTQHFHKIWNCWVYYIRHTRMIQIALSDELVLDSTEQMFLSHIVLPVSTVK
jgi:hypothetical protein